MSILLQNIVTFLLLGAALTYLIIKYTKKLRKKSSSLPCGGSCNCSKKIPTPLNISEKKESR